MGRFVDNMGWIARCWNCDFEVELSEPEKMFGETLMCPDCRYFKFKLIRAKDIESPKIKQENVLTILSDEESQEKFKDWTSGDLSRTIASITKGEFGEKEKNKPFYKQAINEMNRRAGIDERIE